MPPQPLSSMRRDAMVNIDPISLRIYPDLARKIADVIATWSQIECNLGVILARMLGAGVRSSMAMYLALNSSSAQTAALEAAAKISLSPERLELFSALCVLVKRASGHRNRMAHNLWGTSNELPDALVLLSPDAVLALHTNNAEYMANWREGKHVVDPSTLPRLDLSECFVYRENDFREIILELTDLWSHTSTFAYLLVIDEPPNGTQYRLLTGAPRIREELEKARTLRERAQK